VGRAQPIYSKDELLHCPTPRQPYAFSAMADRCVPRCSGFSPFFRLGAAALRPSGQTGGGEHSKAPSSSKAVTFREKYAGSSGKCASGGEHSRSAGKHSACSAKHVCRGKHAYTDKHSTCSAKHANSSGKHAICARRHSVKSASCARANPDGCRASIADTQLATACCG
jgi:hypothetical protein